MYLNEHPGLSRQPWADISERLRRISSFACATRFGLREPAALEIGLWNAR